MTNDEKKVFAAFEKSIDALIEDLAIKNQPIRVTYTHLFCLLNSSNAKLVFGGEIPHSNLGASLLSRMSYVLPIIADGPMQPEGESAMDAIQAMDKTLREEMSLLLQYAHFSEIAPFVWRDIFSVIASDSGITLTHRTEDIQRFEAKDIVLSRLTLPLTLEQPNMFRDSFDDWAENDITPPIDAMEEIISRLFTWFRTYAFEVSPLSDAALRCALGVNGNEFQNFRAAWQAIASFQIGMSDAIVRYLHKHPEMNGKIGNDYFEWVAPLLRTDYLESLIISLAQITPSQYSALMSVFSVNPNAPENSGEGFTPPICRMEVGLLFSPWAIRGMMSSRNILYATLKTDQRKFDEEVSPLLEPHLTELSAAQFRKMDNVQVISNYVWHKGEFDLLIYRKTENCVLHVQIKAAVAPEGARMTERVEGRINEGLEQLKNFRKLTQTEKDAIVSNAVGHAVGDIHVIDVVLCWAGFGTGKIWSQLHDVAPLNIALLAHMVNQNSGRLLRNFSRDTHSLIDEIVEAAAPKWSECTLEFGEKTIRFPNLDGEWDRLIKYQHAMHKP